MTSVRAECKKLGHTILFPYFVGFLKCVDGLTEVGLHKVLNHEGRKRKIIEGGGVQK